MINLYENDELFEAEKKLRFYNGLIAIIVVVWAILFATIFILYRNVEWKTSTSLHRALAILITILASSSLLFIINLPRRMCKGYIQVYKMTINGDPKPVDAVFLGVEEETSKHYEIDFYEALFYEGVNEKGREKIGRVLIDAEKDVSDLEIGDKIKYCACGNVLSAYEILQKQSVSQDEIDVLIKRMEEHIGMDVVLFGDKKKKRKKRA